MTFVRLGQPCQTREIDKDIRDFHHELPAMYLEKYWEFLDIPNEAFLFAIMQVCRGHRKNELLNLDDYPTTYLVREERSVCIPYLAALLRLADELDTSVDRNTDLMYDIDMINNPISRMEFVKLGIEVR